MLLTSKRNAGWCKALAKAAELAAERLFEIHRRVETDGYSRYRVKVCQHLRCIPGYRDEKEWYRGRKCF